MNVHLQDAAALLPTRRSVRPLLLLPLALIAVVLVGYGYYQEQRRAAEVAAFEQLKAIGDLKAQEIARWLGERGREAVTVFQNPVGGALENLLQAPGSAGVRSETERWLSSLLSPHGFSGAALLDATGTVTLTAPSDDVTPSEQTRVLVQEALSARRVVSTDLYRDGAPRLDFIVPLFTQHAESASPVGVLLLRVDPSRFLFPLIQTWPTPSPSAETLMVRREGDEVVFLNELRHRRDTALSLRLPIDALSLSAYGVAGGEEGEMSGLDYRGVSVLAAVRRIPDSTWYMVAKVDRQEIDAPIWKSTARTLLIIVLMMLVASLLAWAVRHRQAEALLLKAKGVLEARIRERAAELESANAALMEEIAERRQVEGTSRQQREMLETIFGRIPVMIALIGADGRLKLVNQEWERRLGWSLDEARCASLMVELFPDPKERVRGKQFIQEASGGWTDFRIRVRNGQVLETSWANVRLSDGTTISIGQDITERKSYESRLEYQANYDALTRLPNRTLLQDRLKHAILHAHRSGRKVAVLFLDLDRFKMINDSLGHAGGDALLQQVAVRLKESVREVDTVARLGGDEFVLVLEDLPQDDVVSMVAGKVLDAMKLPFTLEEQQFFVNCSMGVSLFPKDGEDWQVLLKNADTAMHRAKERGRNGIQYYADEMNTRVVERLALENSLRHALENGELKLHYQPQVDLDSGNMIGVEALLRWQHPTLKMISPAEFVPLAEETGLINPIGEWVLKTACAQIKAWQNEGLPPLRVAVNLSARQFMQVGLPDLVGRVLDETGLEPQYLELEITESLLMQDVEGAVETLRAFKAMGVHLAIDDFGTGYSSLNYLKRFPLDRLKIDRSFVRDITTDPDDAAIALAVIAMAHSLKLRVIAEGVETEAQLAFLRGRHCDEMQGYYFSRPLPAEEMTALLRTKAALRLAAGDEGSGQRTLLLVDDESDTIALLRRFLAGEDYQVLTANCAREALDLLTRHRVGVVVSDHLMPGMNGTEFLQRVRKLYPETVRIVLSGYNDTNTLIKAINEGAIYKFLAKPVDRELLRRTLREAFQAHERQRQGTETDPAGVRRVAMA